MPAGTDLDALVGERPTTQRRGRMRRRLRHLRRVREVLLRDLGGMVFEVHRSGQAGAGTESRLVRDKLARLDAVNQEIHALEDVLGDRRGMVVREPGIGGTCPVCGELHGSDARFCWACGTPVAPGASRPFTETVAKQLPPVGAAANEGEPTHAWADPVKPAPAAEPAMPATDTTATEVPQDTPATQEPPTTVQPHIDAESEELQPGDPVEEHRP